VAISFGTVEVVVVAVLYKRREREKGRGMTPPLPPLLLLFFLLLHISLGTERLGGVSGPEGRIITPWDSFLCLTTTLLGYDLQEKRGGLHSISEGDDGEPPIRAVRIIGRGGELLLIMKGFIMAIHQHLHIIRSELHFSIPIEDGITLLLARTGRGRGHGFGLRGFPSLHKPTGNLVANNAYIMQPASVTLAQIL